ncbi:hypothetical protein KSF78_0008564 [Schistosoma japonicum]|nr:hypothetical protein KSF78_0008564 [Schistosoma japonicum]
MQGLQAPSRRLCECIKPGCKGNFNSDSFSTTSASIRKQLRNGLLKIKHNKLILLLRKASGSDQWSGLLAVRGLEQG